MGFGVGVDRFLVWVIELALHFSEWVSEQNRLLVLLCVGFVWPQFYKEVLFFMYFLKDVDVRFKYGGGIIGL